uniref:glycosyltransferase family 2 protein n=1 Tax=Algoriphagus sp. TaxID=1872435 RepID=UPI0040488011
MFSRTINHSPTLKELPSPPPFKTGWPWTEEYLNYGGTNAGLSLPRISVVMPSFNQFQYIEEAIRSVLLQGYDDLEFIVIDGGSTDGSIDIIMKYAPWLSFWVSEPDRGQSDALNKGFIRSTGDILAWLNSDDIYCVGALRSVGCFYQQFPEIGLLYGDCEMINADGHVIHILKGQEADLESLMAVNFIPQPSAFFSRCAFDKVGGINIERHFIMDYELWLLMALQGIKMHYVPQILSRFRLYQGSKSGSQSIKFGYEYLSFLEAIDPTLQNDRLMENRLKAFLSTFTMIMDCNYLGAVNADILKALQLWSNHLNHYHDNYQKYTLIWAHSLHRIGNHYCLQGNMREGRRFLAKSFEVNNKFYIKSLPFWFVSYLGRFAYKWSEWSLQLALQWWRSHRSTV